MKIQLNCYTIKTTDSLIQFAIVLLLNKLWNNCWRTQITMKFCWYWKFSEKDLTPVAPFTNMV